MSVVHFMMNKTSTSLDISHMLFLRKGKTQTSNTGVRSKLILLFKYNSRGTYLRALLKSKIK